LIGFLAVVVTLISASGASAFETRSLLFTFNGNGTAAALGDPLGVAVDNSGTANDGDVYVTDRLNRGVNRFDASGEYLSRIDGSATAQGSLGFPWAVAVGPDGDVYVSDVQLGRVFRFNPDGSLDGGFGTGGEVVLSGATALALDPVGGELFVAHDSSIAVFDATGVLQREFAGRADGGYTMAVDSQGNLFLPSNSGTYVYDIATGSLDTAYGSGTGLLTESTGYATTVDASTDDVYVYLQSGRIVQFDKSGAELGSSAAEPNAESFGLALGKANKRLYASSRAADRVAVFGPARTVPGPITGGTTEVTPTTATLEGTVNPAGIGLTACEFEYGSSPTELLQSAPCIESPAAIGSGSAPVPVHAGVSGLSADTPYYFRLSATNANGSNLGATQSFSSLAAIGVAVTPASSVGMYTATLNGSVNPRGSALSDCHFEYVSGAAFGVSGFDDLRTGGSAPCVPDALSIPGDFADHAVSADISGLDGNLTYRFRLSATNGNKADVSAPEELNTTLAPPKVATTPATDLTTSGAALHGLINAFGLLATYHFEYGTTTSYGSRAPFNYEAPAGSAKGLRPFTQAVEGLSAGTTYHYRLVATNAAGVTLGPDLSFTTTSVPPPRSYELVSPPDKGGSNIGDLWPMSSPDGNSVAFLARTLIPVEGGDAQPLASRYVSWRTGAGWSTRGVEPQQGVRPPSGAGFFGLTAAISDDGTKAVVGSTKKLAPGAVEGDSNIYLRDVRDGDYTTIITRPGTELVQRLSEDQANIFVDGTPNFDHILLTPSDGTPWVQGDPPLSVYDFAAGHLELVARDTAGNPLPGRAFPPTDYERDRHYLADDGSVTFISLTSGVYVRTDGETRAVSRTHPSSGPGMVEPAAFLGTDRGGDVAYIFSHDLTEDSEPGLATLYRYEVATDSLIRLATVGETSSIDSASLYAYEISDDGSSVYFRSNAELTPGTVSGQSHIFVWRKGSLKLVANLDPVFSQAYLFLTGVWSADASSNGRYFAIATAAPLTSYDTRAGNCKDVTLFEGGITGLACMELYRFDADTSEMKCASCRPDGLPPTGNAQVGLLEAKRIGHHLARLVDDSGRLFFSTEEHLVAADTSKGTDLYEFDGTQAILLSSGHGGPSQFLDSSESGNDVFFVTQDRLVGLDTDNLTDVYDARVNGSPQNPLPPREECIRDDCKATPNRGPELPFGGSEGLNGPENVKEAPKRRCGKGRHARKVKGKQRCVKQHKKNRTNTNRRHGR
jgi:hypothetical protein